MQSSTIFLHKKNEGGTKKGLAGELCYLHDDTSHNVLEGLLELCEAVASKVINMRIARPLKHFSFESKSANSPRQTGFHNPVCPLIYFGVLEIMKV